jgi:regulator of sigma E protease
MQFMTILFGGLVVLGVLIFVHELGHFLTAKAGGIRVLKFSLGFGRKLLGFKWKGTEYLISMLPLGGYVKMAGESPQEANFEAFQPGDYFSRPWWIRFLVSLAGPTANFLTAILVLGMLFWIGFMVPLAPPQITLVEKDSPAAAAGIISGDVITALENQPVEDWGKFAGRLNQLCSERKGGVIKLTIKRQDRNYARSVTPAWDEKLERWRLGVAIAPAATSIIDRVYVGTPAELGGVKKGDRIIAIEGEPIWTKHEFQTLVWPRAEQLTRISIQRGEQELELQVKPMVQHLPEQGRVGVIGVSFQGSGQEQKIRYPFFQAFNLSVQHTRNISKMILVSLGQMVTGQISAKDSIGGPITIIRMAGQEVRAGMKNFLFFLAGISIMLGILNLLPIPILDGGTMVFFIIEGIIRRPLPIKVQEVSQQIGFALLIALMVFATYNDIYKLIASMLGGKP